MCKKVMLFVILGVMLVAWSACTPPKIDDYSFNTSNTSKTPEATSLEVSPVSGDIHATELQAGIQTAIAETATANALLATETPTITETIEPSATSTRQLPKSTSTTHPTMTLQANVLFQDDLASDKGIWGLADDDGGKIYFDDAGGLRFNVIKKSWVKWSTIKDFTDSRTEVIATNMGGPADSSFGIICRYRDKDNFYIFHVTSDGWFAIQKMEAGKWTTLEQDNKWRQSNAINQGDQANHLRADCVGETLTLVVNGRKLSSITDTTFSSGAIGLIVGTNTKPNADIKFENFFVKTP